MSLMTEAAVCIRTQGIEKNDSGFRGERWSKGHINNDGGVSRGQGIDDAAKGLEMMTEAEGGRKQA